MMSKYLQVIWLYITGLVIILVGVYLMMSQAGPGSFILMLVGLGIASIGSAHGRKMRQMGNLNLEELMGKKTLDRAEDSVEEGQDVPEGLPSSPPAETETEKPAEQPQEPGVPRLPRMSLLKGILRRKQEVGEELGPDDIMQIELEDIKSGKLAPTEADVIELVCPRCGAENMEKNYYCFKCGNRLRRKPLKDEGKKTGIAVEPGSISVIGDKKVAKVVICPKCNAANKQHDKYCFNCGKKIRAERVKNVVIKKK